MQDRKGAQSIANGCVHPLSIESMAMVRVSSQELARGPTSGASMHRHLGRFLLSMAVLVGICRCGGDGGDGGGGQSAGGGQSVATGSTSASTGSLSGSGGVGGSPASSGSGTGGGTCVGKGQRRTLLPICRTPCTTDEECCPGMPGGCGADRAYPNNVFCDDSVGACRSAECCVSDDCAEGYECASANGIGVCVVRCSAAMPCPPPTSGGAVVECHGVDDNGDTFCRAGKPCSVVGCAFGRCDEGSEVCACDADSACSYSQSACST